MFSKKVNKKKKNHKFAFSTTLVILFAITVAISTSVVKKTHLHNQTQLRVVLL